TIGRQYGSGGRNIGKALAKALNIPCYDKELLAEVAKESGFSEAVLENYDEKSVNSFYYFQTGMYSTTQLPLHHQLFIAQLNTIKDIAERESCVFVGRCADYVLSEHNNCVNVFIHSDQETRINRIIEDYGVNKKDAKKAIHKIDKQREAYYNFYSTNKWGELCNYHLCIDSAIGIENTVKIIQEYISMR
ncbi:MAG TPA: cytidylate kinase-like family protein, partial [Epulopiscium sp.]|nr:cytidylate kinase-like family protein [Candidatus Epulonipiscium sp.]